MLVKINEHIQGSTDDTQMIKGMNQAMRENLSIRYQSEEQKIMINITSMLDVRFKNMRYNSHKSHRDTLQTEALLVAKKHQQPLNDSETQMPQDSESQIEATQGQSLAELSRNSVIGPKPSKDSNEDDFYAQIFDDEDIDSGFTAEDRTLTNLVNEEIKYYQNKTVQLNHDQII